MPDTLAADLHELLHTFYQAFAGRPDLLDAVVAPDWEDLPPAPGQEPGPRGAGPVIEAMATGLSDLRVSIHDVVDGRDAGGAGTVAVRAEMTGVHTGELMGVAATGLPVVIALHEFHCVERGRITRTWHLEDWFGFLRQTARSGSTPPS